MVRYHCSTGFTDAIIEGVQRIADTLSSLHLTTHSIINALNDKHTIIPIPTSDIFKDGMSNLVEVYVNEQVVEKFLVRVTSYNDFDYTYVISKHGIVITNWSNEKEDIPTLAKKSHYYSDLHGEIREYPKCLEF